MAEEAVKAEEERMDVDEPETMATEPPDEADEAPEPLTEAEEAEVQAAAAMAAAEVALLQSPAPAESQTEGASEGDEFEAPDPLAEDEEAKLQAEAEMVLKTVAVAAPMEAAQEGKKVAASPRGSKPWMATPFVPLKSTKPLTSFNMPSVGSARGGSASKLSDKGLKSIESAKRRQEAASREAEVPGVDGTHQPYMPLLLTSSGPYMPLLLTLGPIRPSRSPVLGPE